MPEFNVFLTSQELFAQIINLFAPREINPIKNREFFTFKSMRFWFTNRNDPDLVDKMVSEACLSKILGKRIYLDDDRDKLLTFSHEGSRTIWFNSQGELIPDLAPFHDGDLVSLDEIKLIPSLLEKPTLEECYAWWDEWRLPDNVRQHEKVVARCAYILGVMLHNRGIQVDPILAHRGGLLHDLDKIETLHGADLHGEPGAVFVAEKGYRNTADIIRNHILRPALQTQQILKSWEAKLVFFCDKLVEGDQIISFGHRLDALKNRYPLHRDVIEKGEPAVWEVSEQICSILSLSDHKDLVSILQENL